MTEKIVSIIIPIYNEKDFILETLRQVEVLALPGLKKELILVDDGSTDGSLEILDPLKDKYKIVILEKNQGVGAALRNGIKASTGDYIVRQDVDLEYAVSNIPGLLLPLTQGMADVVYGSRSLGRQGSYSKFYNFGSAAVNRLFNLLYFNRIYNFTTAAKAFKREVFNKVTLKENRFEIESEISAKILRHGFKIVNVPIMHRSRTPEQGKKMRWYYTFKIIATLFKYRFKKI